jgi:hypothetical protein
MEDTCCMLSVGERSELVDWTGTASDEAGSLVTNHMHTMYLRGGICQCLLLMLVSAAVVKPIDTHAW